MNQARQGIPGEAGAARTRPRLLVAMVTYNSAADLPACLDSLGRQSFRDFTVAGWDNASTDGTLAVLDSRPDIRADVVRSEVNLGYGAGHNRLLARHDSEYVLFLNPDTVLDDRCLERAVAVLDAHPECGSLSPKILRRPAAGAEPGRSAGDGTSPEEDPPVLDSTGIYWTTNQRHFDRGGGEPDRGWYNRAEYVFGVTGAAAFYRRACLEDVAFRGEIWDEDFFLYREDADLAWRAAWRGWKCLYEPSARVWHARRVLADNRRGASRTANLHSVKNRFLLRFKNMPLATWLRFCVPITGRDLAVLAYVPFFEPSSLPAFGYVVRLLPRFLAKRRAVLGVARTSRRDLEAWFRASSRPLPDGE
jgi:GT2 family glycosyltransferase